MIACGHNAGGDFEERLASQEVGQAFPIVDSAAVQVALAVFEPAKPDRARGGFEPEFDARKVDLEPGEGRSDDSLAPYRIGGNANDAGASGADSVGQLLGGVELAQNATRLVGDGDPERGDAHSVWQPVEQAGAEPMLEPRDDSGQWRLCHAQAFGRPADRACADDSKKPDHVTSGLEYGPVMKDGAGAIRARSDQWGFTVLARRSSQVFETPAGREGFEARG